MNPAFIDPTEGDEAGETTSAPPATDSLATTQPPPETTSPTSTTYMTSTTTLETSGPDTEGTIGVTSEGSSTTMPLPESVCGNGVLDPGEQCDDGDDYDYDACPTACINAYCGDGFAQDGMEPCDDGNNGISNDGCLDGCMLPVCGDGIVDIYYEACDDGNSLDDDGCDHDCRPTEKIIFVSSKLFTGMMGGLDGADTACNLMAMTAKPAPLPGYYMAWLSTNDQSPVTRMNHSTYPYVRTNRSKIVGNWTELVNGTMFAPIDLDEHGNKHPGVKPMLEGCGWSAVHTNTPASGQGALDGKDCMGWTGVFGDTLAGSIGLGQGGWTDFCGLMSCGAQAPIYCVQQ
jgi:cysteine-rich repeat protein